MIGPQKEMAEVPLLMTIPMTLTIAPAAISADFSDFAYLRIHTRIASSTPASLIRLTITKINRMKMMELNIPSNAFAIRPSFATSSAGVR